MFLLREPIEMGMMPRSSIACICRLDWRGDRVRSPVREGTQMPRMGIRKAPMLKAHCLAALAALFVVGAVTPAHAIPVTYSTAGVFGSSGTTSSARAAPRSGSIPSPHDRRRAPDHQRDLRLVQDPAAPPSPGVTLVDTFTLTITQTAPAPGGTAVFTSTVGGTIFLGNSQAFIQFNAPLRGPSPAADSRRPTGSSKGTTANPGRLELFGGMGPGLDAQRRDQHRRDRRSPSRGRWPWPASPCRCWAWDTCVVAAAGRVLTTP